MTKLKSKKVIRRERCPKCAEAGGDTAGNNLAVYEDGGTWCYSCNDKPKIKGKLIEGNIQPLRTRAINEETCRFFNYQVGQYTGKLGQIAVKDHWVQVANYCNNRGTIIAQKLRDADKNMTILGNGRSLPLYGMWKYKPNPNLFITITEGEIDCLSIAQAMGLQYPVVSLANGASSARKAIETNLKWLMGFKYVVLAFDNDDVGREAAESCLDLFEYGRVRVAQWPTKDANELLVEGDEQTISTTIWNARNIAPDSLVTISDKLVEVLKQPQFGVPYPWEAMTKFTYGFQFGEIHIIVAANGIGKTEFVKDIMFHFLEQDVGVGLFSFEQPAEDTIRRLVGAKLGLKLHLPGAEWDEEKIRQEALKLDDKLYLCDRTGSISIDELLQSIRYLAKVKHKRLFIIDNIRGLGIGHDVEIAGNFMRKLQQMVIELKISVFLLSHVAKDKYGSQVYVSTSPKNKEAYEAQTVEEVESLIKKPGMDWESGRMPSTVNVDGPSVICDLANYVWCLARNKTSEDYEESHIIRVKAVKTRLDGEYTGNIFKLRYTSEGRLEQVGDFNRGSNSEIVNRGLY